MAELVARSEDGRHWWSRPLHEGQTVALGRQRPDSDWVVPWDPYVSRIHAVLHWKNGRLWVRRHPDSKNPIYVAGQEASEFTIGPRETFVIGRTVFEVRESPDDTVTVNATPEVAELVMDENAPVPRTGTDPRLHVLFELPEILERLSATDEPVHLFLSALLKGMPNANFAALVRMQTEGYPEPVEVVTWVDRDAVSRPPRVSHRLVRAALKQRRRGIAHIWADGDQAAEAEFTAPVRADWAICVPVEGGPDTQQGFYVAGALSPASLSTKEGQERLAEDLRFVDLVGRIYGGLCRLRDLQARQSLLAQFFPRPILGLLLSKRDLEQVLRPQEVDATVLFCDLRGSSHYAEGWEGDPVDLWHRISDALSVMSGCISDQGGILGDLQGDSAMGFWGWPVPDEGRAEKAVRAAAAIYRRFQTVPRDRPGSSVRFRCGIGVASGRAVAGRLGTPEQFKVTVYGPVTNVAARLQQLSKHLAAVILVDEATAEAARRTVTRSGWAVLRRIGKIRLTGMARPTAVFEVLPVQPSAPDQQAMLEDVEGFEAAMRQIESGDWESAASLLEPRRNDPVARVLFGLLRRFGFAPPENWEGVIEQAWFER